MSLDKFKALPKQERSSDYSMSLEVQLEKASTVKNMEEALGLAKQLVWNSVVTLKGGFEQDAVPELRNNITFYLSRIEDINPKTRIIWEQLLEKIDDSEMKNRLSEDLHRNNIPLEPSMP